MILLSGATGFVGGKLLREMLKHGVQVRCLVRNLFKAEAIRQPGVELIKGDVTDKNSILNALNDGKITMAVHLVGILAETGQATFQFIHIQGTRNMVEACKEKGVKRFVHISALGTRENARSEYHKTKWEAEEIIRNSGLEYTIFRPSVLFGKEDKFVNLFAQIIKISPFIMIPGNGQNKMQPLYVKDLVRTMTMAVQDAQHINKVYEIGGAEKLTFDQIIDTICGVMGKKRLKIHVPMFLMRPGAAIAENILPKPPITRDQILMLEEDNITDNNALESVFGIKPVRFEEGIREYLRT
ncbi:MAG: complex I NDUFA9 subunit family protein [Deltaproteobacteria bacterium]|nr:complex I NDUFA9 subunit family protein [Deltaproteobacteria bacterium]MBI3755463.1 complex I NDUFA9 subunit family protein [Deltaproteobacteria bacterium]